MEIILQHRANMNLSKTERALLEQNLHLQTKGDAALANLFSTPFPFYSLGSVISVPSIQMVRMFILRYYLVRRI